MDLSIRPLPLMLAESLLAMPPSSEALVGAVAVAIGTAALTPKAVAVLGDLHQRWTAETPRVVCSDTETNQRLLARCPHLTTEQYHPLWYLFNGHLQTLQLARANDEEQTPSIPYARQILDLPDGGIVSLDWALPRAEPYTVEDVQPGKKTVLILPGLTGGSSEHYIRTAVRRLNDDGWQCVVLNARGCANTPLKTPHLFCIAYTGDLRYVAKYLNDKYNFASDAFTGLGFSLGSNVLVKYLGEEKDATPLTAAISVGNPFDIIKCSNNIDGTLFNRLTYSKALGQGLQDLFFNRSNAHEVFRGFKGIDIDALRNAKTVYEFDALFTIKHFNYGSVEEFYTDGSCITRLPHVTIPLLCLNAEDDPISIASGLPSQEQVEANPNVILCTTKSGGHLAFYENPQTNDDENTSGEPQRLPVWSVKVIAEFAASARLDKKQREK